MDYEKYMALAIEQAKIAYENNEVPIGCVIIYEDKVIGKGANRRVTDGNVLSHAEIIAINEACKYMKDWRLEDCILFVTVEPCPMCSGAILQARVPKIVYGTRNPKAGCVGSVYNLLQDNRFNHTAEVVEGVLQEECSILMKDFFKRFRK
jgi:tRNA-specific adenosine deaminase